MCIVLYVLSYLKYQSNLPFLVSICPSVRISVYCTTSASPKRSVRQSISLCCKYMCTDCLVEPPLFASVRKWTHKENTPSRGWAKISFMMILLRGVGQNLFHDEILLTRNILNNAHLMIPPPVPHM